MIMEFRNILCLFIASISLSCNGQKENSGPGTYQVDPSITTAALKSIKMEDGMAMGQMDIKMFENDKEIQNTFDSPRKMPFITRADTQTDLISISGFAGMFAGFGFELYIKGDSCQVFFHIATDEPEIYKLNLADTVYKTGLLVPCVSSKLILSKKPTRKNMWGSGESLSGYLELESQEFYERSDAGKDNKFRVIIKTYFTVHQLK